MKIVDVWFDAERIYIACDSGQVFGHSVIWYPRLANASPDTRKDWRVSRWSDAIRWDALDEDLSLEGFLYTGNEMLVPKQ